MSDTSLEVAYRFCWGDSPPITEVTLSDGCETIVLSPVTVDGRINGDTYLGVNNASDDMIAYFHLNGTEMDQLIAELQRARAGCFRGEWPRPVYVAPGPDPEQLERLLAEEAEIERRTRERDVATFYGPSSARPERRSVNVSNSFHYGGTVGGAPPRTTDDQPHLTVQGRPTVRKLREFLEGFDDEQSLAIDVRVTG